MKKVLKFLCVVMVICSGISLIACGKDANNIQNSGMSETKTAQTTENQTERISETQNNYYETETTETHYNHSAIQGCVIVEQDGSFMLQYSEKCESCGYVSARKHMIYHEWGTYTSSFMCPDCHNTQSVEIETSQY